MFYRTGSFTYEGNRLVYDVYDAEGKAAHEPDQILVYLHGLLLDSDLNRGIAEALAARGNRVVLLDLLGHGRSDKPLHAAEYRIDTYARQVFAVLDELEVHAAVLGGLSLGANVSLFAATQQPERVQGLVLEMPVLEWAVPTAAMLFAPMVMVAHYGRRVASVTAALARRIPSTPFPPLDSLIHAAGLPPEVMAAVLHGILVGPVAPTREARRAIESPTLVLAHRNDLIHPFDDATNLADQLPHSTLVRARSPLELRLRPTRLTDVVATFLDEVWTTEPDADTATDAPDTAGSSRAD